MCSLVVRINDNKMFCAIFLYYLPMGTLNAVELLKKAVSVPSLLPQTHDHKVFQKKFLLKSLDSACILTFITINQFQWPTFG
jgi:hypothetical protein